MQPIDKYLPDFGKNEYKSDDRFETVESAVLHLLSSHTEMQHKLNVNKAEILALKTRIHILENKGQCE